MKKSKFKYLITFLIVFLLTIQTAYAGSKILTTEELVNRYKSIERIGQWIWFNIWYKSDKKVWKLENYWQSPEETLKLRSGDCEDFAILFAACAKKLGWEAHIVAVIFEDKKGKEFAHALALLNYSRLGGTCEGIFDNAEGLYMYRGPRSIVSVLKYDYKRWTSIFVYEKTSSDSYSKNFGWRIIKRIYNKRER